MSKYDNNPVIEGRYDAYGRKTYWQQGFTGQKIKVAIIDTFANEHGHQMVSVGKYIAPDAEIVMLEMQGSMQGIRDMLYEAIKQNVNIVSISRGTYSDTKDFHDAVIACQSAGIVIFCSAGNDGDKYPDYVDIKQYPAAYQETISVQSINNNFSVAVWSSHTSTGTICGFGQNVLVNNKDGSEELVDGTSATTAACAFTLALHQSKILKITNKRMTVRESEAFIKANCVDLGIVGKDSFTGYGFFTLDKRELWRTKTMILDANKDGLEDRVNQIKALVVSGMCLEDAEYKVSRDYLIIGYEDLNGIKVPIYGGKVPM